MAEANTNPIDKLSLVVASSTFEKVHYAFVMAAGAAASGIPVTMFFTMGACNAVLEGDGWKSLVSEKPSMTAAERDSDFATKGVASMGELIDSCAELNVQFIVCEMGLRAEALEDREIRADLKATKAGVVTFFNDTSANGSIIYI